MILFLTNNAVTEPLFQWLSQQAGEEVCKCSERLNPEQLHEKDVSLIISYNYRHIIKKDILDTLDGKIINLHISFLPYNRGASPNFWSFIDNTPKGVTIHVIDEGIDTGDILVQKQVVLDERTETLSSSYQLLHREMQQMFITHWQDLKRFRLNPQKQLSTGTFHYAKDFDRILESIGESIYSMPIYSLKQKLKKRHLI